MTRKIGNSSRLITWFVALGCGCALLLFSQKTVQVQAQREHLPGYRPSMTVSRIAKPGFDVPLANKKTKTETNPVTNSASPCTPVIWNNGPFNNVDGLISMEGGGISARTADDFVLTSSATIQTITFDIYADTPVTQPGAVDIYPHSGGIGPSNVLPPLATYTSTNFTVVGSFFGLDIRRYTVTLSPPLTLSAGRYWVSGYVVTSGSGFGYLCTSDGAVPSPEQVGHFRSAFFGYPNWTPVTSFGFTTPHFAFTVCGENLVNVNSQVQLLIYPGATTALFGCPGYPLRFNLTGLLTNIGPNTLSDITIRVKGLGFPDFTNPNNVIVAFPNPHRLASADDFVACTTGGIVNSVQTTFNGKPPIGTNTPIPTLNPGQSTSLFFRVNSPANPPVRFLADVLAIVSSGSELTPSGRPAERQVVATLEVEIRRNRQGQLVAEVINPQPARSPQTMPGYTKR